MTGALVLAALLALLAVVIALVTRPRWQRGRWPRGYRPPHGGPVPPPLPIRSAEYPMTHPTDPPQVPPVEQVVRRNAAREVAAHLRDQADDTVYSRIGGRNAFRRAVTMFYDCVVADPGLSGPGEPFWDMSLDRRQRLEGHLRAALTLIAGAEPTSVEALEAWAMLSTGVMPAAAGRRDIRAILYEAHRHLYLTERHFSAVASHLAAVLRELHVAPVEINALTANLAQYKDALVRPDRQSYSAGSDALL